MVARQRSQSGRWTVKGELTLSLLKERATVVRKVEDSVPVVGMADEECELYGAGVARRHYVRPARHIRSAHKSNLQDTSRGVS